MRHRNKFEYKEIHVVERRGYNLNLRNVTIQFSEYFKNLDATIKSKTSSNKCIISKVNQGKHAIGMLNSFFWSD